MLVDINITNKIIGNKQLIKDLNFYIEQNEKIGIIGRNGVGKTTLFNILGGIDSEFEGEVSKAKNIRIVATLQEHHTVSNLSALEYITTNLPDYKKLKNIIDTYPDTMGENIHKIAVFTDALNTFSEQGYYDIEPQILETLKKYQINKSKATMPLKSLSGGQKRFVELVRVQYSNPDLALIDEPTNHMDAVAKQAFIEWLNQAKHACVVITHDRDVLATVDKIIELKDFKAYIFKGNYKSYLKQNSVHTTNKLQSYEVALKTINNLKGQIAYAIARAPGYAGKSANNPFIVMRDRLTKQLKELEANNPKPSFWIDQESVAMLNPKITASYDKYKQKNIKMAKHNNLERQTTLLSVSNLTLGYDKKSLFLPINFRLLSGERLHILGRNGTGKTTLVNAIMAAYNGKKTETFLTGIIEVGNHLRLNSYSQEIDNSILNFTLYQAIEDIFRQYNLPLDTKNIMQQMGNFLFDPSTDANLLVSQLSGGQKARLQLIKMLVNQPNLLILDEPTNHLDLPSIEELENSLKSYHGAIIYISHDSYFSTALGGETLKIVPNKS